MKLVSLAIIIIALFGIMSCNSIKNIAGTYRSNFADLGFFVTLIKLKQDSTFEYRLRGDMFYDTATGHYQISGRKLSLYYKQIPIDTTGLSNMIKLGLKPTDNSLTNPVYRSELFYIGHNKIFESYRNEKIIKKAFGYSKRKKYYLFGTHYYKHKHYLKRVD